MKTYKSVLVEVKKNQSPMIKYNKLVKLRYDTEDDVLRELIDDHCKDLNILSKCIKTMMPFNGSKKESYDYSRDTLIEYCEKRLRTFTPEWQVIARRNGWGPLL
jgi:hypothetical protein